MASSYINRTFSHRHRAICHQAIIHTSTTSPCCKSMFGIKLWFSQSIWTRHHTSPRRHQETSHLVWSALLTQSLLRAIQTNMCIWWKHWPGLRHRHVASDVCCANHSKRHCPVFGCQNPWHDDLQNCPALGTMNSRNAQDNCKWSGRICKHTTTSACHNHCGRPWLCQDGQNVT